ncbi:hypothetical protein HDU98_008339, partial [Podochytrium sp. JEL0797]
MLEWRAMELEAQRLLNDQVPFDDNDSIHTKPPPNRKDIHDLSASETEDEHTHSHDSIALVPLPSYKELTPVPAPPPLPITNSSKLPKGARDALLQLAQDVYGAVFDPETAPTLLQDRIALLPEELHWTAYLANFDGMDAPAQEWPFDDAAMFSFLIKYGQHVNSFLKSDVPKEVASIPYPSDTTEDGSTATTPPLTPVSPSIGFAAHRNQETWKRICESIWCLIRRHQFCPEFVLGPDHGSVLGGLHAFLGKDVKLDALVSLEQVEGLGAGGGGGGGGKPWILSQVLHHDEKLGRVLAEAAGVESQVVEDELVYW